MITLEHIKLPEVNNDAAIFGRVSVFFPPCPWLSNVLLYYLIFFKYKMDSLKRYSVHMVLQMPIMDLVLF